MTEQILAEQHRAAVPVAATWDAALDTVLAASSAKAPGHRFGRTVLAARLNGLCRAIGVIAARSAARCPLGQQDARGGQPGEQHQFGSAALGLLLLRLALQDAPRRAQRRRGLPHVIVDLLVLDGLGSWLAGRTAIALRRPADASATQRVCARPPATAGDRGRASSWSAWP